MDNQTLTLLPWEPRNMSLKNTPKLSWLDLWAGRGQISIRKANLHAVTETCWKQMWECLHAVLYQIWTVEQHFSLRMKSLDLSLSSSHNYTYLRCCRSAHINCDRGNSLWSELKVYEARAGKFQLHRAAQLFRSKGNQVLWRSYFPWLHCVC